MWGEAGFRAVETVRGCLNLASRSLRLKTQSGRRVSTRPSTAGAGHEPAPAARSERRMRVDLTSSIDAGPMAVVGVRREKAALSSGCEAHPAKSLQPEAIGAVMEVTKWLKPSISGHNW